MSDNIIIGCDHAAFNLKESLKFFLKEKSLIVTDVGVYSKISVDYPDIGSIVASRISKGTFKVGVLMCGTGIGMSMVANRFPHVRAALCNDILTAKMSKKHNDSNILVMGSRVVTKPLALKILEIWFSTKFERGRHQRRLDKLEDFNNFDLY